MVWINEVNRDCVSKWDIYEEGGDSWMVGLKHIKIRKWRRGQRDEREKAVEKKGW